MYKTISRCPICNSEETASTLICTDHTVSNESFSISKCDNCGLLFTNPIPENLSPYYESEDYISHKKSDRTLIGQVYGVVRRRSIRKKYSLINREIQRGSILDIGCGVGSFLKYFQDKGWHIEGVESSDKAREAAEDLLQTGIHTDIKEVKEKYDVITLWHVLEHLPELNFSVSKIKELLKKDSTLYVAVPNHRSLDAEIYKEEWAGYDVPRHLYHFDRDTIRLLFANNGMKVVDVLPLVYDSYYVSLLSEKYLGRKGITKMTKSLLNGWKSNTYASKSGEYSSLIYKIKLK